MSGPARSISRKGGQRNLLRQWAERKWSQVTEDTGIGDPSFSTKEKGQRFFEDVTHKLADLMYALAKADKNNLYEQL